MLFSKHAGIATGNTVIFLIQSETFVYVIN